MSTPRGMLQSESGILSSEDAGDEKCDLRWPHALATRAHQLHITNAAQPQDTCRLPHGSVMTIGPDDDAFRQEMWSIPGSRTHVNSLVHIRPRCDPVLAVTVILPMTDALLRNRFPHYSWQKGLFLSLCVCVPGLSQGKVWLDGVCEVVSVSLAHVLRCADPALSSSRSL